MGYSQYGGMGYRNGAHVPAASDALITADLVNHGTPGGFPAKDVDEKDGRAVGGHVVIGDGPVLVSLYKHTLLVHLVVGDRFQELDLATIGVDLPEEVVIVFDDGTSILSQDRLVEGTDTLRFEVAGHVIEYRMIAHYRWVQHARITQPDGTVWTGFCGSEIGAGHDDEDTDPIARRHLTIFDGDDSDLPIVRDRRRRR